MKIKISNKWVGDGKPCFIIAEVGSNHCHDLEYTKKLVDDISSIGVDAIKFQSYKAETLSVKMIEKDGKLTNNQAYDIQDRASLPYEWHKALADQCRRNNVIFMSSVWSEEAIDNLEALDCPVYKVGSGDLNHLPLLRYLALKGKPIILSVGMADMQMIKDAVKAIESVGNKQIGILHCIVNYPQDLDKTNLAFITKLKEVFDYPIGYSDHSLARSLCIAAVAMGADIIERHITTSRNLPGPDHHFAATIDEFADMVKSIREVERARGSKDYAPGKEEFERVKRARRSAYAIIDIPAGETLLYNKNYRYLRPGGGMEPKDDNRIRGKIARTDISKYKRIGEKEIE